MILDMINILPEKRLSADQYLKMWCPRVFPEYFSPLLHDFFSYLVPLDTDSRVSFDHFRQLFKLISSLAED
jgi:phosphoinositide-3-kinase regulatory subunit 4